MRGTKGKNDDEIAFMEGSGADFITKFVPERKTRSNVGYHCQCFQFLITSQRNVLFPFEERSLLSLIATFY